ncbi:MAG: phosphoglycolate phosphatase [Proteobacteria bacterium]|nr:phosphoglycolate phosphatase [Pseudomonadota bacterium]MDE3207354.1 phosphoglycolate phosphatase [Pseudomonadota bacterium]
MGEFLPVRAVLFDLDGTLVDSLPDLLNAANAMLMGLGRPYVEKTVFETYIGNGMSRMVKRLLTGQVEGEPPAALFDEAIHLFESYYSEHICEASRLYNGVREGLEQMQNRGFSMGIVTNKSDRFTRPLLKELDIHSYFPVVVSGDTLSTKKPSPEPLLHAAKLLDSDPSETLMVGDSFNDIQAARQAGCPVFCVRYGYIGAVGESGPQAVKMVSSLLEVNGWILPAGVGKSSGI